MGKKPLVPLYSDRYFAQEFNKTHTNDLYAAYLAASLHYKIENKRGIKGISYPLIILIQDQKDARKY